MATQEAYVQVKDLKKHYGDGDARLTVLDGIDTSINLSQQLTLEQEVPLDGSIVLDLRYL